MSDAADPKEGVRKLPAVVGKRIPGRSRLDSVRDIQVLCPTNRGGLGARSLNIALQAALNPPGELRVQLGRSATASGYRARARFTTSGCFAPHLGRSRPRVSFL